MTTATTPRPASRSDRPTPGRRFGYIVAIIVNAVALYIAHRLLDWAWPSFLTDDFERLLPFIDISYGATIVANLVYLWRDPRWLRAVGGLVGSATGLLLSVRSLQVFPVDFSGWDQDWSWLVTVILVVGLIGSAIGVLTNLVKLTAAAAD